MSSGCCIGDCGFHPIQDLVDFFSDIFCNDCSVGKSSGPTDSEKHARKVAEELAEMKESAENSSKQQESKIMDYINSSMSAFMKDVEELNNQSFGGVSLNINTVSIKEKNEKLKKQVVGCISKVMNKRLVQTDKELSIILEEKDDKKRKANFDSFIERVRKQAIETFKKTVEKTVKEQSKVVSDEIKIRQKEVNARMAESITELTAIMELKEKSTAALEEKQIDYMYQSSLCDLLLMETEG